MKVPVEAEVLNFLGAGVVRGFEPPDLSALEIHLNARLFTSWSLSILFILY